MPKHVGPTTESGILFQNRVAALRLGRLLDLRPRPPGERLTAARVEALDPVDDIVVTFADVVAAQTRLAATGFTDDEVARYQEIGMTAAEIEELRQAYVTPNPADKVITMRQELADFAASYRAFGNLLISPPPTFSQQIGGGGAWQRAARPTRNWQPSTTSSEPSRSAIRSRPPRPST